LLNIEVHVIDTEVEHGNTSIHVLVVHSTIVELSRYLININDDNLLLRRVINLLKLLEYHANWVFDFPLVLGIIVSFVHRHPILLHLGEINRIFKPFDGNLFGFLVDFQIKRGQSSLD
jgi:hypothetical protein